MKDQHKRSTGMMTHVRKLSVDIGARPPASEAEGLAGRYVENNLRHLGLKPAREEFRSRRHSSISLAACYLIMILSVLCFRGSPLGAPIAFCAIYIMGLFFFLLELMGKSVLGFLDWRFPSANIVTRLRPYQETVRKVVVLAHLDSHHESFYHKRGWAVAYRPLVVLQALNAVLLGMWLVVIVGATVLKVDDYILIDFWRIALVAALPLFAAFLAVLSNLVFRRFSSGANDDASGIALLLNIAGHFSQRTPSSTELWLVALGCEDSGTIGLKRFLHAHRSELKGAAWIFLEGVGGDKPLCFRREGLVMPFHTNRALLHMAEDINRAYPHYGLQVGRNHPSLGSGYRLLSQGRKAITIGSRPESTEHDPQDDYGSVDPKSLRNNYAFVLHFIENIDKKGFGRKRKH